LEELRKLAAGTSLKCLAFNQMVFARQEKDASEKLEKEVGAGREIGWLLEGAGRGK
jgi:hypothetical protein